MDYPPTPKQILAGNTSGPILDSDVAAARALGLCLHNDINPHGDDNWHAATPAWLSNYMANGGLWSYSD